ncbi:hypothetical protein OG352_20285 [Streptomyces sp. NBC_01485]|uniref:hypothetical protein n=1 Tax=Streptomyces sp. NBC_01485 TaxID=2903884 RepID=UPI002E2EBD19|nr:hypothetical protein [Streptomyces sp. NBC_01485]
MTTPYPPQHPAHPNPAAPQGGYAPNGPQHPAYAPPATAYGQPPQGPYAQQHPQSQYAQQHPQAPYGQQPQYPAPTGVTVSVCRICTAQPASADIEIRQHTGLILAMRTAKVEGPLCRTCATAIHRDMTAKTLAAGWFSVLSLFLLCWLTLAWNLYTHFKITKLPHPTPTPTTLTPGKPIFQRPLAYVGITLVASWLVVLIVSAAS